MSLPIPFVIPQPNEIVNLAAIKRIHLADEAKPTIHVHFVDGKILTYEDNAARVILGSAHMHRSICEQAVVQMLEPSQIITPIGGRGGM